MQQNIKIEPPGKITQIKKKCQWIKNASLNIREEGRAKHIIRIPVRHPARFYFTNTEVPHGIVESVNVILREGISKKYHLLEDEDKK